MFMIPVGMCEWKITNAHTILAIMFKNVLGTFLRAEILKTFKPEHSASAPKLDVPSKKEYNILCYTN